jgi:hypothetical protein
MCNGVAPRQSEGVKIGGARLGPGLPHFPEIGAFSGSVERVQQKWTPVLRPDAL